MQQSILPVLFPLGLDWDFNFEAMSSEQGREIDLEKGLDPNFESDGVDGSSTKPIEDSALPESKKEKNARVRIPEYVLISKNCSIRNGSNG